MKCLSWCIPLLLVVALPALAEPATTPAQRVFLESVRSQAQQQGLLGDRLAAQTTDSELLRFGNSICMARRYQFASAMESSYREQAATCPKAGLMVTAAEAATKFLCPDLSAQP